MRASVAARELEGVNGEAVGQLSVVCEREPVLAGRCEPCLP